MTTWLPIVIILVAVLAIGFVREHFRVSAVERWARAKGFKRADPLTPDANRSIVALAARLHPRGTRNWGIGLDGLVDASPCTIAEYSASKPGTRTGEEWFTLVTWQVSGQPGVKKASLEPEPSDTWPHDGILVRAGHLSGWRLPGTITASRLDDVIKLTPEARQLISS
jgi:hypothetical protein